jgi:hypothetical protein
MQGRLNGARGPRAPAGPAWPGGGGGTFAHARRAACMAVRQHQPGAGSSSDGSPAQPSPAADAAAAGRAASGRGASTSAPARPAAGAPAGRQRHARGSPSPGPGPHQPRLDAYTSAWDDWGEDGVPPSGGRQRRGRRLKPTGPAGAPGHWTSDGDGDEGAYEWGGAGMAGGGGRPGPGQRSLPGVRTPAAGGQRGTPHAGPGGPPAGAAAALNKAPTVSHSRLHVRLMQPAPRPPLLTHPCPPCPSPAHLLRQRVPPHRPPPPDPR